MGGKYYSTIPHNYYLSHIGVLERSGRYPWGSGKRPYQRLEESSEERRARVLNSGTASEVKEYVPELSNKELQDIVTRIELTNKIDSLSKKDYQSGFDAMNEAMGKVGKVNNWISTGLKTYKYASDAYKIIRIITA